MIPLNMTNESLGLDGKEWETWANLHRLSVLLFALCAGLPPNVTSLIVAIKRQWITPRRLYLLQIHRSLADILVLTVLAGTKVANEVWWGAIWHRNDYWCRINKFGGHFSIQLSSMIILCIAADRYSVIRNMKSDVGAESIRSLKWFIGFSWLLALLLSMPAITVHTISPPLVEAPNYTLCNYIWTKPRNDSMELHEMPYYEKIYIASEIVTFYIIPAVLLAILYACIWANLRNYGTMPKTVPKMVAPKNGSSQPDESTNLLSPIDRSAVDASIRPSKNATSGPGDINGNPPVNSTRSPWRGHVASRKAMRKSILIASAFIIMWLPYCVLGIWQMVDREGYVKHVDKLGTLSVFIIFNSVVNPWLYGIPYKCSYKFWNWKMFSTEA